MQPPNHIFVYGTLQRGQCRERCWPHAPLRIDEGTIRATLYDLGPYPAIGPGDDLVRGEIWEFAAGQMADTLRILDEVEGYNQSGGDLYVRRLVTCRLESGVEVVAWSYYFGDADRLPASRRIKPGQQPWCQWPASW